MVDVYRCGVVSRLRIPCLLPDLLGTKLAYRPICWTRVRVRRGQRDGGGRGAPVGGFSPGTASWRWMDKPSATLTTGMRFAPTRKLDARNDGRSRGATPQYTIFPDGSKQPTFTNASGGAPAVDCGLNPKRHGHRAYVTGLAYQVDNRPISVATLNPFDLQVGYLRSSKAATQQETQHAASRLPRSVSMRTASTSC